MSSLRIWTCIESAGNGRLWQWEWYRLREVNGEFAMDYPVGTRLTVMSYAEPKEKDKDDE